MSGLLVVGQSEIVLPRPEKSKVDTPNSGILEAPSQVLPPLEHNPIRLSNLWGPWPDSFFLPLNWKVFIKSLSQFIDHSPAYRLMSLSLMLTMLPAAQTHPRRHPEGACAHYPSAACSPTPPPSDPAALGCPTMDLPVGEINRHSPIPKMPSSRLWRFIRPLTPKLAVLRRSRCHSFLPCTCVFFLYSAAKKYCPRAGISNANVF